MAKKGYGADATLVAAGFRLGQSYVPGDYSSIFEKQYQGLIAANKAKAQAKIDVLKSIDEKVGGLGLMNMKRLLPIMLMGRLIMFQSTMKMVVS